MTIPGGAGSQTRGSQQGTTVPEDSDAVRDQEPEGAGSARATGQQGGTGA